MKISKKVTKRLDKIKEEYMNQDNVMSEVLATESADGLTIEEACELYMRAMNIANGDRFYTVLGDDPGYFELRLATDSEKQQLFDALAKEGEAWDAEKKMIVDLKTKVELKPFDKVLVRNSSIRKWEVDLFGYKSDAGLYHCVGYTCNQCIPYEGNEHLLGTTNAPK